MSHLHRVVLAVGLTWSICAGLTWSAEISIPSSLKVASSLDAGGSGQIEAFVKDRVAKLADKTPDVVSKARTDLIEAARAGAADLSAAYAAKYAEVLNAEVCALLDNSKDIRTRLNAAVAAARVAEAAHNTKLEAAALKLLDQSQVELRILGVRTAKSVLPELISAGSHQRLLQKMMAVVQQSKGGAMAEDAYEGMTPKNADGKILGVLFDPMMALVQARIELYRTGAPEDPERELIPFAFLMQRGIWNSTLSAQQRLIVWQATWNLLALSARKADEPGSKLRDQVAQPVQKILESLFVASSLMSEKPLAAAAIKAKRDLENPNIKMTDAVKPIGDEIRKVKGFEGVKDP